MSQSVSISLGPELWGLYPQSAAIPLTPSGWRILLKPVEPPKEVKTRSGVVFHLPDDKADELKLRSMLAEVIAVGPLAYRDEGKFGPNPQPWCKVGDHVLIARFAGSRHVIDKVEYRLLNDDEILGVWHEAPEKFSFL